MIFDDSGESGGGKVNKIRSKNCLKLERKAE